jgi:hypothetical protein
MLTTSFTHNFVSTLNVPLACLSTDGVFCASHFLSTSLFPKQTQLVRTLCILHNFCIDEKKPIASLPSSEDVLTGMISGGFAHDYTGSRPEPLMDNGHHFDDVSAINQRNIHRRQQRATDLPRERLLAHISEMGITRRPAPFAST